MALLTSKHKEQMESLRSAAQGGLAKPVADFILSNLELLELHDGPGVYGYGLDSRKAIQSHIDTLHTLVDTWVHRSNWERPSRKKKGT